MTKIAARAQRYTPEQTERVLSYIACKAGNLVLVLNDLTQRFDGEIDNEVIHQLYAVEAIVEMIGAAADEATGGSGRGGYEEWLHGSDFASAGKAGAA